MKNEPKILLADNQPLYRRGLIDVLASELSSPLFTECSQISQALDQVAKQTFDLVLLDISLAGPGGLETIKQIKLIRPDLPVLIMSMHPEDQYAVRMLRAGAAGYLMKTSGPEEVCTAVTRAISGGKYVSPVLAEKLALRLEQGSNRSPDEQLSDREYQILRLLASGKSSKQIASDLEVTSQTISTHRARMLKKLHLATTAALIRYALEHRMVE